MRYFFHIAYQGTRYSGWQKHPDGKNVQELLETALSRLLKIKVNIIGCGRTDAGVHACQFFFHANIEETWSFNLLFRLNKILPDDVAVFDIIPMQGFRHARFDAVQRTYDYFIHTYKDPFLSSYSSFYPGPILHLDKMKAAADLLLFYNDYKGFCKMPDRITHTICNVSSACLYATSSGDKIRFSISSNRFLSKMVRIIAGCLVAIGRGAMSVDEFERCLIDKETPANKIPAHPQGLYLTKVTYPYLDIPAPTIFTASLQSISNVVWLPV